MSLYEYVGNLHIHTPYSDGTEYHEPIAEAARRAGLDFIVVTDHNIRIGGVEGYYGSQENGYVLVLTGEEIHDRTRLPQVNHCLVYNVQHEMTAYAKDPQQLIDAVEAARGLSFLAHPFDKPVAWLPPDGDGIGIPWVDWHVTHYTGLEVWNYMAVWKDTMPTPRSALRAIFRPEEAVIGPRQATLNKWDELLATGQHVVGIGNSDAHGVWFHVGPFRHRIFPYDFLFSCVNTHILTPTAFSGDLEFDRQMIFDALRLGRAYIGYDLPGDTRGFRFSAQGIENSAEMGDKIRLGSGVTLQILPPHRAHIKIIRHGEVVAEEADTDALVYTASQSGAYRVEVWHLYRGQERCWILSNPIYVVKD
ncbi:MAG TPA: CehA/McbA family metallohydrolase [Aggregatilineales bacterium]|nr:CehA/McbA family metallohydrolase [Aggregatilineales bacterium]